MSEEKAIFAGGCFWCVEAAFKGVPGVVKAVSGYTGGNKPNPTYEEVCRGDTGHYEAVEVTFDPSKISYGELLDIFWRQIDPTDPEGQFADKGTQYMTAIFYFNDEQKRIAEESKKKLTDMKIVEKPVATKILKAQTFYPAEEYHQGYAGKQPGHYGSYKYGSGRAEFTERFWKDKPRTCPLRVRDVK